MTKAIKLIVAFAAMFFALVLPGKAEYSVVEAKNLGYINIWAYASWGYSEASVHIQNLTSADLVIDFSTVYFTQSNYSQRIGLSYEKLSGNYLLLFHAGYDGWLTFSSRCLDLNRHGPTTGDYFTTITEMPTPQFLPIINGLRNNFDQGSIWQLTDQSGGFSQAWKGVDSRPYAVGTGEWGIQMSGSTSWQTSGKLVNIRVAKVANNRASGTSGSLRIRLWATSMPYSGGSINGYVLGVRKLNPLRARHYYSKIVGKVPYTRPPSGIYYTTLTVEEFTGSRWVIRDFITYGTTSTF